MRTALAIGLSILLAALPATAADGHKRRLPKGYSWGRCLLVIDGKTYISGRCIYTIQKGGSFNIDGPNQIYEGIDYPRCDYGACQQSNDYWAWVNKEPDGTWSGYASTDIHATHGNIPFETLTRKGACYSGRTGTTHDPQTGETFLGEPVRVCLWRD